MNISYNWLKRLYDPLPAPDKVAEMLTGCGLEVEGQENFQSVKGGLKGVVIGQVLTCEKHPNSDHLSITTVDIGQGTPLNIVCGASNVARGQKVAVATPGTTLCFSDKEVTLQRTKIRGEVSEGMICAEDELGLGNSHDGILVLDSDAPVGMPAREFFQVEEDIIFTIGLTPNRVDAASHLGVARDLVAVANNYGRNEPAQGKLPQISFPDVSSFKCDHDKYHLPVIVEDTRACPRYSGLTISGISVTESPDWLKNRLLSVGLRPINNIVDITNYILMETGQPLHAFDGDCIAGNKIVVRKYPRGTKFTTLDNIERKLSEHDLMISNSEEPMCIAGVFGGARSGVTTTTTRIFLESAFFDPQHIRRTSKHHGLQTDASFRFERGADHNITVYALKLAALMIREIAGGEISSEIVDVYPDPFPPCIVVLTYANLDRLIGKTLHREVVKNILSDLGIRLLKETNTGLHLEIPSYKVDVTREADVIEEILRIYGYNNIEVQNSLNASISYSSYPDPEKIHQLVSGFLAANGFLEIMNNSLSRSSYYIDNADFPAEQCVKMLNPLSRDLDVMRQTLLYGCLESVVYNQNRKNPNLKMFEFGRVYSTQTFNADPIPGYHEEKHLALVLTGRSQPENWNANDAQVDFYELKGLLEGICARLDIEPFLFTTQGFVSKHYSNGLRYMHQGKTIFVLGFVDPVVLKSFDCRHPVLYAEVNWESILSLIPPHPKPFRGIPKFPAVRRDLAIVVDREIDFEAIQKLAYQTEKKLLKNVGLFDVYEGEKIAAGKKSYALGFILQSDDKTLTDKEIDKTMQRLLQAMVTQFKAQLR